MAKREFSAGGLIFKRSGKAIKILLVKDSYNRWTWPKGNIDKGESPEQAALREINEEVGLSRVEIVEKLSDINYFYRLKGNLIFKTVYLFLVRARSNEKLKVLESELRGAQWLSAPSAIRRVEYKGAKEIIAQAIRRVKQL